MLCEQAKTGEDGVLTEYLLFKNSRALLGLIPLFFMVIGMLNLSKGFILIKSISLSIKSFCKKSKIQKL